MTSAFPSLLVFFPIVAACGASVAVPDGPGAGTVAARDASSDAPLRPDAAANDGEASRDTGAPDSGTAGKCATAEPGSCVECCRLPAAPNYGGFELYAYELCEASPACSGFSPCGTNSTPPGGATCVQYLKKALAEIGVPAACAANAGCTEFAACLEGCGGTR